MPSLIPHLRDLVYQQNKWNVAADFAVAFVEMHASADDPEQQWPAAQRHWERVVARALDTDAVDRCANGDDALRQAVFAAAQLLNVYRLRHHHCPLCPRSLISGGGRTR